MEKLQLVSEMALEKKQNMDNKEVKEQTPAVAGRYRVVFTGAGRGCGTSLLASLYAGYCQEMGKTVVYTECGEPAESMRLLYDSYGMEERFGVSYVDFYRLLKNGERLKGKENRDAEKRKGLLQRKRQRGWIDWHLITPTDVREGIFLQEEKLMRLTHACAGEIQLLDVRGEDTYNFLLEDADLIVVVTDPLPSGLLRCEKRIADFRRRQRREQNVFFLINRMNTGVSRRRIRSFFQGEELLYLPYFDPERLYACEYRSLYPWADEDTASACREIFTKISRTIGMIPEV